MSLIQIRCDQCGAYRALSVRQNHQARRLLRQEGWTSRDVSSRFGTKKKDFCPAHRRYGVIPGLKTPEELKPDSWALQSSFDRLIHR